MRRCNYSYMLVAMLVGAALLAGCGTTAQTGQSAPSPASDILPTPPPMPTGAPAAPTATPPPAPAPAGLASGAALLQADFNGAADLAGWTVLDASDTVQSPSIWEIQDGRLSQISDGDGLPGLYASALLAGERAWRDYSVSAAAYSTGNDEMGVVARASQQGYYVFRLLPAVGAGPRALLARYDAASASFTTLASADAPGFAQGRWYTLGLRVRGDRLEALVDGQPVVSARDAALASGQAGVYGYANGGLTFDNVTVRALPNGG